uniref:non-specific serine/threonine protein kinase n=1 Tax=Plautia stali TaxID=106108 RepID=A0A499U4D3_PLAST|nr:serine/threonine-protein kinase pelle [Plautia stali]
MFVYDLPYNERKQICKILDLNKAWEQLGGSYMKFDVTTLKHFEEAPSRNRSPTDELLTLWGTHNHTVLELFVLLSRMQHYQAMMILKPFVDLRYHRLIYEGEENFSQMLVNKGNPIGQNSCTSVGNYKKEEVNGNLNINLKGQDIASNKDMQKNKLLINEKIVNKKEIDVGVEGLLRKKYEQSKFDEETLNDNLSLLISYAELERATGSWDKKNILGKGGFGTVYKGIWKNTEVAIKRLEVQKEEMDESCKTHRKQSLRELRCLNSYRHDNILPLYGYSIGGSHDCLVYQYMTNGSLEDRLLCRDDTKPLSWSQRVIIATGTARGLQYLHTIGDKPLIHGDIKSANILLDPYLVPKIGDFGLAREGPLQQYTHVKVSRVHGTRPYLPDEFLRAKKFSIKVDTYSFGVVLFELATGLRVYDDSRPLKYLKDVVESCDEDKRSDLKDIKAGYDDGISFSALISLGMACVSSKPKDRPEMVEVLRNLDAISKTHEITQQAHYAFYRNSPTPVLPYELQLKYDHLSQHRKLSISPNGMSPVGITDNSPPLEHLNSRVVLKSCTNNINFRSNLRNYHDESNSSTPLNRRLEPDVDIKINDSRSVTDVFIRSIENSSEENDNAPIIRIEPPSVVFSQNSGSACDELPLISALGIKEDNINSETGKSLD